MRFCRYVHRFKVGNANNSPCRLCIAPQITLLHRYSNCEQSNQRHPSDNQRTDIFAGNPDYRRCLVHQDSSYQKKTVYQLMTIPIYLPLHHLFLQATSLNENKVKWVKCSVNVGFHWTLHPLFSHWPHQLAYLLYLGWFCY